MATGANLAFLLLLLLPLCFISTMVRAKQQSHHRPTEEEENKEEMVVGNGRLDMGTEAIGWSTSELEEMLGVADDEMPFGGELGSRRSLLWISLRHYYISYGALSANRIPCPPRSGRSYYTHNCYRARGPVRPYRRGCPSITRCRREA
ncbi:protein RALF-like 34 [Nymphaea colorata]|uniref:Rapid ALkalinization Factor n=1 Tax=Nymphaea colorata TaxID=210225 RepID=A0A5K0V9Y8_9MAGN|nr:protein RALF-like 34 [Nymphaea colorata]